MSHQLQTPMLRKVTMPPSTTPAIQAPRPPPVKVTKTAPPAFMTRTMVRITWPRDEVDRRCRRKIGKRPKTSMEKRVREKTWVVEGRREASTVDAISAELVEMEAGSLFVSASVQSSIKAKHTECLCPRHSQRMPHSCRATRC
jgi:hypothetical protein